MNDSRMIRVPDRYTLKDDPQRGPLAVLVLALSLAESALLNSHAACAYQVRSDEPPAELARVLLARSAELRGLIPAYLAVLERSEQEEDIPF
jgi:hypothetical protein